MYIFRYNIDMSLKRLNITLLIMVVTVIIDRAISPLVPMALSLLLEILAFPAIWWYRKLRRSRPANLKELIQQDKELQARREAVRATARPMYASATFHSDTAPTPTAVVSQVPAPTAPVLPSKPKVIHTTLKATEAPITAKPSRPRNHPSRPSASYLPRLRQARPRADYASEFIGSQY